MCIKKNKAFVIDRKNFILNDNKHGGTQGGATIFSMIKTAKENGQDPYQYLLYVLQAAPNMNLKNCCYGMLL